MAEEALSPGIRHVLHALAPYVRDSEALGRISADLKDLVGASRWLLSELSEDESKVTNADELENFLIDLEVRYLDHAAFHISSLKDEVRSALEAFPTEHE